MITAWLALSKTIGLTVRFMGLGAGKLKTQTELWIQRLNWHFCLNHQQYIRVIRLVYQSMKAMYRFSALCVLALLTSLAVVCCALIDLSLRAFWWTHQKSLCKVIAFEQIRQLNIVPLAAGPLTQSRKVERCPAQAVCQTAKRPAMPAHMLFSDLLFAFQSPKGRP